MSTQRGYVETDGALSFIVYAAIGQVLSFFFQAEDGIRDVAVTGVQTCALPISRATGPGVVGCSVAGPGRAIVSALDARARERGAGANGFCAGHREDRSRSAAAWRCGLLGEGFRTGRASAGSTRARSEEHTSELQSRLHLVCRLLLDKKNDRRHPVKPEQTAVGSE